MPSHHLVTPDPRLPQRCLLDRMVVAGARVFERVAGAAVSVDQQPVVPLGIDAAIWRDTQSAKQLSPQDTERLSYT